VQDTFMLSIAEQADLAATQYFRSRLPPEFIRGLPAAIVEGYRDATRGLSDHLAYRRAATDRYWAVMEALQRLGESIPGMKILELTNPNGGGPYIAVKYQGTVLTIHKADSDESAPRSSTSRSVASRANEASIGTLFPLEQYERPPSEIDSAPYLDVLNPELLRMFDLYVMITHGPDVRGVAPEFVSGIVIDSSNRVLAKVDVLAEAGRLAQTQIEEMAPTVEIVAPEPRRKSQRKEESA
jgi:hypothetical protein